MKSPLVPRLALLFSGIALIVAAPAFAQPKEKFTAAHVAKLRTVMAAEISPDGKQIAYELSVPRDLSKEKDGPAWTELHVVDANGNSRPYISGEVNVSRVGWTPDGKSISFLAKRKGDKNRALYLISPAGGESRKVLEHDTTILSYSWSSDGKRVAFLATAPQSPEEKAERKKGFNQEIYEEDDDFVKVWIAEIDSNKEPRALDLDGSVWDVHWAPKGDLLAVSISPLPLIDHRYMFRKIRVVNADTGRIYGRLNIPGKMGQMAWDPNGEYVAVVAGVDKHDPREGRLWIVPARGGKWRDLTPDLPGHVLKISWQTTPGGESKITALIANGVQTAIRSFPFKDGKVGDRAVTLPPRGTHWPIMHSVSVCKGRTAAAFVGDTPKHPGEVYILDTKDRAPRRLTDSNPWLKNMRFAKQEVVTHEARDGLKLQGILIRPLDEEKGKRYPLVLTVHGGPEAHVPNGWVTRYAYLGQVGAANGFAVFYPNYRGSTGRGVEFSKMGQADAAGKEFDDLVDAVDHLVATGLVDKNKVGITGGSYGGYATAWSSTYYSKRFAAGVMFVGISDGISKTGTTDIPWEMNLVHHRKWLWEDWNYFVKSSPIYYVQKARTPLLILHGKNDPRVHPGQSMELFRHLKVLGKTPVRLVFYPGEGHGNRRAASRFDYNLRLLRWMKHYLQGPGGSPPPKKVDYDLGSSQEVETKTSSAKTASWRRLPRRLEQQDLFDVLRLRCPCCIWP